MRLFIHVHRWRLQWITHFIMDEIIHPCWDNVKMLICLQVHGRHDTLGHLPCGTRPAPRRHAQRMRPPTQGPPELRGLPDLDGRSSGQDQQRLTGVEGCYIRPAPWHRRAPWHSSNAAETDDDDRTARGIHQVGAEVGRTSSLRREQETTYDLRLQLPGRVWTTLLWEVLQ